MTSGALAVVIPFYERREGNLRAALRSVMRQTKAPETWIVVVDDGSPVPIEPEIEAFSPEQRSRFILLRQPNAGPSVARNLGLANVPAGCEWVAFLDSDDQWADWHIERALSALEAGHDVFFGDFRRANESKTQFELARFGGSHHVAIPPPRQLYSFRGPVFEFLLGKTVVGTSSVVFRRSALDDVRFDPGLRICEDSMFWIEASRVTTTFAFGMDEHVLYGPANHQPDDWRSQHALDNQIGYARFYRNLLKLPLTAGEKSLVRDKVMANARSFSVTALAILKGSRRLEYKRVMSFSNEFVAFLRSRPVVAGRAHSG